MRGPWRCGNSTIAALFGGFGFSAWLLSYTASPATAPRPQLGSQVGSQRPGNHSAVGTHGARGPGATQVNMPKVSDGAVLWVVRTFKGHGSGLGKLLQSIIAQKNRNWVAVLMNTDSSPFADMASMAAADDRIVVLSDLAERKFSYFEAGYKDTDLAVQLAWREYGHKIRWLVCTNGDNVYDPEFLSVLDPAADVVGTDFFCRWDDFSLEASLVSQPQRCKLNTFQRGMTDLGANAWNFHKWVQDNITFSRFTPNADDSLLDQAPVNLRKVLAGAMASQDGQVAEFLVRQRGWAATIVHRCLYSHSPNPWECKRDGMVWLDSPLRLESACLSKENVGILSKLGLVDVTQQPDDYPDYARWSSGVNQSRFQEGCQVESDIELWVRKLSKMVKFGEVSGCPDICFSHECGSPGVMPRKVPCNGSALLSTARAAGWSFDAGFYGDNPNALDLRPMAHPDREAHFVSYGVREERPYGFIHPRHGRFTVNYVNLTHVGEAPPRGRPGQEPLPTMLAVVLVQGLRLRNWA